MPTNQPSVRDGRFAVLANGSPGSPPASGLIDYLRRVPAAQLTTVFHPLGEREGDRHEITVSTPGRPVRVRTLRIPSRPPATFPFDLIIPPVFAPVDGWFAFNNLLCARGLWERARGRAGTVVYWAVDFVPDRFGAGTRLTRIYDALDAYCCRHADVRVELSSAAMEGRDARHGLGTGDGARRIVSPVGAWLDRVPVSQPQAFAERRVVFIGHLVERMGADTVIAAAAALRERGVACRVDIAGTGPLESTLREDADRRGLGETVRFHGFISDHEKLEGLLAQAAIALAPYSTRVESFTRFADPSKLKAYLGAGLPILMTDVPPNAAEVSRDGGAEIVDDEPAAFAAAIERLLSDRAEWERRRDLALAYRQSFDWGKIVPEALAEMGWSS